MRNIPTALQAKLDSGVTTLCRCWTIARRDGVVQGFTDHDVDVAIDAVICRAETGLSSSEATQQLGLAATGGEIAGALAAETLNEDDLASGLYDAAGIKVYLVDWSEPALRVLLASGVFGEVRRAGAAFAAELRGLAHRLQEESGRRFTPTCDADLGDARCGVDLIAADLKGDDDLTAKVSADGATWKEAFRADRSTGKVTMDGMTVSRDAGINVLPDSGRFIGNGNNHVLSGVSYAAPTYLTAIGGSTIVSLGRFIHDNNDYGGAAGTLDPIVKELVDKIRPPAGRRYGPEWFALKLTRGSAAIDPTAIGGAVYDMLFLNSFVPLPIKLTAGYYVRVLSGTAAIMHASADKSLIDDAEYTAASAPTVLTAGDGWKYVNMLTRVEPWGYNYSLFGLKAVNGAEVAFAMPRVAFGHVAFDKNLGVLPNDKIFG